MLCVGLDKDNKRGGGVEVCYNTDGSRSIQFTQRNRADSGYNSFTFKELTDGNVIVSINGSTIRYITQTWNSGNSWYRVYSDGWIEQGGKASMPSSEGSITLHKAFSSTAYCVYGTSAGQTNVLNIEYKAKTTTMFYTDYAGTATGNYYWYACGY